MSICAQSYGVTWIVGENYCDLTLRSDDVSDGWVGDLVEGGQDVFGRFFLGRHFYRVLTVVVELDY